MKKKIKKAIQALCFILTTGLLMCYFSNVMFNGISSDSGARADVYQYIDAEEDDTIDVLFIGDSVLYASIIPMQIWNDTRITSYIVGYGLMTPQEAYNDLKYVLKKQTPKIVFLEPSMLLTYDEDKNPTEIKAMGNMIDYLNGSIEGAINDVAPLMRYKSEWSSRTFEDLLLLELSEFNSVNKGYVYSNNVLPPEDQGEYTKDVVFNNNGDIYFEKIFNLCKQEGATLSLISLPDKRSWSKKKHDKIVELSEKYELDYVDFSLDTEKVVDGFLWSTDTQDGGHHLNYNGATKLTVKTEEYIRERYNLPQTKLQPEQEQLWDWNSKQFYDNIGYK